METTIWQEYQDDNIIMLGIINTSNQSLIDGFIEHGSSGGVQGGDTYDDYYMPNDGSPYPRDFIVDQDGILQYANNEIDTEWMLYVLDELTQENQVILGDINGDGISNILDLVSLVNLILYGEYMDTGDLNENGMLNILDVVLLANLILGNE